MDSNSTVGSEGLTIDELAARTGVPSRTIRFYQAKGVLPPPRKRGRVALYDDTHAARLKTVAELQDKGLRLRAIRELCKQPDLDAGSVQKWLGIGQELSSFAEDAPKLLSEEELKAFLGDPPPGTVAELIRREAIEPHGEGAARRFLVKYPALVELSMKLNQAGIDVDTAGGLHDILERRLGKAADELVEFALGRVGHGFGRSNDPDDVMRAVKALLPGGPGEEAMRLIFAREVDRAVNAALKQPPDHGPRKHRRS